jgi:hypothetical protein
MLDAESGAGRSQVASGYQNQSNDNMYVYIMQRAIYPDMVTMH